jgi:hypothetical protein
MMGAESVEYHRATVLGRADDHPGMAMEYYASRGGTPLVWGGAGAAVLGLSAAGTAESYEAVFGPAAPRILEAVSGWCRRAGPVWRSSFQPTRAWPSLGS